MWFESLTSVARTLLIGSAAYASLIIVLRVAGKRSLSQLNAFDFVVTVAIGSTLSTILLDSKVTWAVGTAAFLTLAALQFLLALITSRLGRAKRLVAGRPVLLLKNGLYEERALRKTRLTREDVMQKIRNSGIGDVSSAGAVVLEADGRLSVISTDKMGDESALSDVRS
ncbi:Protein of unknown function [Paramicrobacterium humi]|uniref:DUF421 domain-containing protein n=1 Tax=Paramicrobacterium humi TaxID=640635 RepID=A0A1H4IWR1_9MICO|nr:YetF domain-containing protein [Microbacterium humi]SEB38571.1 Protein of unknown function [Microbacterium humi]